MRLIHHVIYFFSCVVIYIVLLEAECRLVMPLVEYLLPSSWFWVGYGILAVFLLFPNPQLTWLAGNRISRWLRPR